MAVVLQSDTILQFIKVIFNFHECHPEYTLFEYNRILRDANIEGKEVFIETADVSQMNGKEVMALLFATVRAAHFGDEGIFIEYCENGCFEKWLRRLQEIDKNGDPYIEKPKNQFTKSTF